jgi:putative FmdB family regulatory protein
VPTYEYACESCGHEFEEFQSITAAPLKKCPGCGRNRLNRLIGTGAGLIFKGSGFYQTDYRSESYKQAAEAEKKSAEPAKLDAGKKDAAPAAAVPAADSSSAKADSIPAADKVQSPQTREPKQSRSPRKKSAG